MATNDFLPFATGGSANVLTQAQWVAYTSLLNGFQSGVAQSNAVNKAIRQSSIMAAVLGQFIANTTGQNATDDGTTATLLANLIAAVKASSNTVVGTMRNAKMAIAAASVTATLTADEVVVGSALGGLKYTIANFSQTVNLTTTGVGGMDTGAAPTSGYVALYAIYNLTTGAQGILAVNATSTAVGSIYGGANMPSGYTASALISVWPTNAGKQLIAGLQIDRKVSIPFVSVLSTSTTQASVTALSISGAVPPNARKISGTMSASSTSTTPNTSLSLYASGAGVGIQGVNTSVGAAGAVSVNYNDLPIAVSQTTYYTATSSAGTPTFSATVSSYEF